MKKEIRPIVLTMENGDKYTLEFNLRVAKRMAQDGFKIMEFTEQPVLLYDFFYYSFLMHQPRAKHEMTDGIINDIWGGISNIPKEVIERLGELYNKVFSTLSDEEIEQKKSKMTVTM